MSNQNIDLNKILRESRETLLNPKEYFATTPLTGGYAEPVIKAAIYGTVAGLFSLLWTVMGLSALGGTMWSGAAGITALIYSIIGAILALFIGGAVMLIVSAICGGNTDYEANVRVAASLMVVYPINAFLGFLFGINTNLGSVVGLFVSLFSVYLLYQAAIHSLKGKESSVRVVAIVLVLLTLLGSWGGRRASRNLQEYSDRFEQGMLK